MLKRIPTRIVPDNPPKKKYASTFDYAMIYVGGIVTCLMFSMTGAVIIFSSIREYL